MMGDAGMDRERPDGADAAALIGAPFGAHAADPLRIFMAKPVGRD
jgi:hypothetical protein